MVKNMPSDSDQGIKQHASCRARLRSWRNRLEQSDLLTIVLQDLLLLGWIQPALGTVLIEHALVRDPLGRSFCRMDGLRLVQPHYGQLQWNSVLERAYFA